MLFFSLLIKAQITPKFYCPDKYKADFNETSWHLVDELQKSYSKNLFYLKDKDKYKWTDLIAGTLFNTFERGFLKKHYRILNSLKRKQTNRFFTDSTIYYGNDGITKYYYTYFDLHREYQLLTALRIVGNYETIALSFYKSYHNVDSILKIGNDTLRFLNETVYLTKLPNNKGEIRFENSAYTGLEFVKGMKREMIQVEKNDLEDELRDCTRESVLQGGKLVPCYTEKGIQRRLRLIDRKYD